MTALGPPLRLQIRRRKGKIGLKWSFFWAYLRISGFPGDFQFGIPRGRKVSWTSKTYLVNILQNGPNRFLGGTKKRAASRHRGKAEKDSLQKPKSRNPVKNWGAMTCPDMFRSGKTRFLALRGTQIGSFLRPRG